MRHQIDGAATILLSALTVVACILASWGLVLGSGYVVAGMGLAIFVLFGALPASILYQEVSK